MIGSCGYVPSENDGLWRPSIESCEKAYPTESDEPGGRVWAGDVGYRSEGGPWNCDDPAMDSENVESIVGRRPPGDVRYRSEGGP